MGVFVAQATQPYFSLSFGGRVSRVPSARVRRLGVIRFLILPGTSAHTWPMGSRNVPMVLGRELHGRESGRERGSSAKQLEGDRKYQR